MAASTKTWIHDIRKVQTRSEAKRYLRVGQSAHWLATCLDGIVAGTAVAKPGTMFRAAGAHRCILSDWLAFLAVTTRGFRLKEAPIFAALLVLGACNSPPESQTTKKIDIPEASVALPQDFADADATSPDYDATPVMQAQVVLDQLGFSPGVIDGKEGSSYFAALRGFQVAQGLGKAADLDDATRSALEQLSNGPPTRVAVIPASFTKGPFFPDFPGDAAGQAKLSRLGYRNVLEALAERFHTTPDTIKSMNPGVSNFRAGTSIRVPNIPNAEESLEGSDPRDWGETLKSLGVSASQPQAERVVVDKSEGVVKVYGADDALIAQFPATMGSSRDPLPLGNWNILGVSRNPEFHYNPKLFWDVSNDKDAQLLNPGPNSPVGVAWIDLDKKHYGIHGTSEPQTIGSAESHGCIRLTNWDAARLAQMIKPGTPARLQE